MTTFIFIVGEAQTLSAQAAQTSENRSLQLPWVRKQGDDQAQGVIIFVHGVLGDRRTTWSNARSYWPELLTKDKTFDGQDIYVYEYPSPKLGKSFSIDEVAENLRLVLSTDGVLRYKTIIFVSHSMGGLVTRAFLIKYQTQVVQKVRFLLFLATPTTGNPFATLASIVSKNPQFGQMYSMNNPDSYLAPLQSNWLAGHFGLKSYCAYETQPLFGLVKIVDQDSATHLCTEHIDPVDADHISIAKPLDPTSTTYRALKLAFEETKSTPVPVPNGPRISPKNALTTNSERPAIPPELKISTLLNVTFTNSPLFTTSLQRRIREDLTNFRSHLMRFGLDIPPAVPPISIGSSHMFSKSFELTAPAGSEAVGMLLPSGGRYETRSYPGQKPSTDFNQNIVLMESEIGERSVVTTLYGMYAISTLLERVSPDPTGFFSDARSLGIRVGAEYFSSGFLNQKQQTLADYGIYDALWEVRSRLGGNFTDRLVAFGIRAFNESIHRSMKSRDVTVYFYDRIKDGAGIIDDTASMRVVDEIWLNHHLPVR